MEPVRHYCGRYLWRHETGGVAKIVRYSSDGNYEIDHCPNCGAALCDRDISDARGKVVLTRGGDEE